MAGDADPLAMTDAYIATVGAEAMAKSNAYDEGNYWLILWNVVVDLGILYLIMHYGISQKIRDWVSAKSKRAWLQTALYTPAYILLSTVLVLPWSYYQNFVREQAYDLSNHTLNSWFMEAMTGLPIAIIATTVLATGFYTIVRRSPQRWWFWGTGLVSAFMVFMLFISPVVIAPLFNDYTPMPDSPLKARIIAMAQANGVPVDNVYVVNQSKQTTRISANVQGLGATARISLNDNLLNNNSEAEIVSVVGHEIGHYVLGHKMLMLVYFILIISIGFLFVNKVYAWARLKMVVLDFSTYGFICLKP